jgi:hypothetical protein
LSIRHLVVQFQKFGNQHSNLGLQRLECRRFSNETWYIITLGHPHLGFVIPDGGYNVNTLAPYDIPLAGRLLTIFFFKAPLPTRTRMITYTKSHAVGLFMELTFSMARECARPLR